MSKRPSQRSDTREPSYRVPRQHDPSGLASDDGNDSDNGDGNDTSSIMSTPSFEEINPFEQSLSQVHTRNPSYSNQDRIASLPKLNVQDASIYGAAGAGSASAGGTASPDSSPGKKKGAGAPAAAYASTTSYENPLSARSLDDDGTFSYLHAYSPYFRNSSVYDAQSEISLESPSRNRFHQSRLHSNSNGSDPARRDNFSDVGEDDDDDGSADEYSHSYGYDYDSSAEHGKRPAHSPKRAIPRIISRSLSYNNAHNQQNDAGLEKTKSLLVEAIEGEELPALKDGFKEALGSKTGMGLWLPIDGGRGSKSRRGSATGAHDNSSRDAAATAGGGGGGGGDHDDDDHDGHGYDDDEYNNVDINGSRISDRSIYRTKSNKGISTEIIVHDDDIDAYDDQPRGAIKLQNLPISAPKTDPSLELLSPNYASSFRRPSAESVFNSSSLEEGLGASSGGSGGFSRNNSSQSINSGNSELKKHLTSAFQKFSSRIVRGEESDANLKRLSHSNNSNVSILNDANGVSDLSKSAEANEQQSQHPTIDVEEVDVDMSRLSKITDNSNKLYANNNSNISLSAENIAAPETSYGGRKLTDVPYLQPPHQGTSAPSVAGAPAAAGSTAAEDNNVPTTPISEKKLDFDVNVRMDRVPSRTASVGYNVKTEYDSFYARDTRTYNRKLGLYGKSLKIFGPHSAVRVSLARLLEVIPDIFFLAIYILHTSILAYQQWNPPITHGYYYTRHFTWLDFLVLSCNVVFTMEIVAKIISFGFYDNSGFYEEFNLEKKTSWIESSINRVERIFKSKQQLEQENAKSSKLKHSFTLKPNLVVAKSDLDNLKDPFLRSNWNVVDFVSCVAYWISLLLSINNYDINHHFYLFRALSCFRIFRLTKLTEGTFTILRSLEHALPQLANICLFILYFWVLLSIAGVQTFKASFKRQCVYTDPSNSTQTFINSDDWQFCGAWLDPTSGDPQPYILENGDSSNIIKGYYCPRNSKCVSGDNPYEGTVSFDNILHSLELVYVVMSMNTFTDLMYYTMDAENMAASIFFIIAIFIMSIWLMNIFIAVIVSSFKITSELHRLKASRKRTSILDYILFTNLRKKGLPFRIASRVEKYHRFEVFWVTIITVDMVSQACRKADSSHWSINVINTIEFVVTYLLLLDIIVRFFTFLPYWRYFLCYKRNQFDLILAIITSVIVIPAVREQLGQMYNWLTIFQIMRFYRVVIAVKFVRELWLKVIGNFKTIGNLTLFFFLFLFLYSVLTSTFFEGVIDRQLMEDNEYQFALNTLPNTFIALYVITSTENWTDVLYALQENAKNSFSGAVGSMILIGWFIFSNSIILNIFIAIIAENMEVSEHEKKKEQVRAFIRNLAESLSGIKQESLLEHAKKKLKIKKVKNKISKQKTEVTELFGLLMTGTIVDLFLEDEKKQNEIKEHEKKINQQSLLYNNFVSKTIRKQSKLVMNWFYKNPFYAKRQVDIEDSINPNVLAKNILMEDKIMAAHQRRYLENNPGFNTVLYIFAPRNRLRRFCQMFVGPSVGERVDGRAPDRRLQEFFNLIMLIGTIGIVVLACYATPLYSHSHNVTSKIWYWTLYADLAFALLFTLEFLTKVIADGLLFTPNGMLRSSWNVIDVAVLITLWLNLIFSINGTGSVSRIVRGFKALRALRLLTISETAKTTFHRIIIAGFGKILGAAAVSFCLLFPFSIWGLNIFNGRLATCNDSDLSKHQCYGEYSSEVFDWHVVSPRAYKNPYLFFDSFPHSFSSLFQISSLEGWVDLLEYVTQSTGVGTPTEPYAQPYNAIFLVTYMFLAIVFILNLFVSVIISNYTRTSGSAYLTNEQRSWNEVKKLLNQVTPTRRPRKESLSSIKLFLYNLIIERNPIWQLTYDGVLLIHLVILLMESADNSVKVETFRNVMFLINAAFFFINSCLKQFVKGFNSMLLKNKWDVFQFAVSGAALLFQIVLMNTSSSTRVVPNIAKALLLMLLILIIPRSNRLSLLLKFASASLPSLLSLLYTWLILFMVYAIALNQMFGLTKIGEHGTGNMNVRTVTKSLILLFKMSFGEEWNAVMNDYYVSEPYCYNEDGYSDCGSPIYAHILFISWNVISMFIFLNLFISLVVENFSYVYHRTGPCSLITRQEIRKFKQAWMKFDPNGTGFIPVECFYEFLHSLSGILSFKLYDGRLSIKNLSENWFDKTDSDDPYDIYIDFQAMKATLDSIDVKKVRHRKVQFERFVEEAILNMEMNGHPGISFNKVLMQIPLYTQFQDGACLSLNDYLERYLLLQKLDKRISKRKRIGARKTFIDRWRFLQHRKRLRGEAALNF